MQIVSPGLTGQGLLALGPPVGGLHLCRRLHWAGARLVVADLDAGHLAHLTDELPAEVVAPESILEPDVDVLAPCALGAILDRRSIPRLRAKVVAGAANNQLATDEDGRRLVERGILYAPDYVLNAGGVIHVAREHLGETREDVVRAEVERIPERLIEIFEDSERTGRPTNEIADALARRIVAAVAPVGLTAEPTPA